MTETPMQTEAEVTSIEGELRQNLMRGYRRVRSAQSQGVHLLLGECVLELLGDPHLLVFADSAAGMMLKIPIVFVSDWKLDQRKGASDGVKSALQRPEDVLTGYRRSKGYFQQSRDRKDASVHEVLVTALSQYVSEFPDEHILLDWLWAPRPVGDHEEVRSENWFAYRQAQRKPNSIFRGIEHDLPSHVRSVDGLVRLTFPISEDQQYPVQMITIVLGLDLQKKDNEPQRGFEETISKIARMVRQVARVLMGEIPQLYARVTKRQAHRSTLVHTPDWVRRPDRDPLHVAVDDLHRKIISLAARIGLPEWMDKGNGFNFLIAFRELGDDYRAILRYCLSVYNLHALGTPHEHPGTWREEFENSLTRIEGTLEKLFERSDVSGDAKRAFREYYSQCVEEIDNIFATGADLADIKRDLAHSIETLVYRMRLTPGYWVMDQCHPEVIQDWLSDPRARHFDEYPARLLAWETTALPDKIYYSPIVDGAVPVGVCGVNEQLISSDVCPAYELQELIDESAPRLRAILSNKELDNLEIELKARLRQLGGEIQDGSLLWAPILRRFRRLAYYYLPDVHDYRTKLVGSSDLTNHFASSAGVQRKPLWWEFQELSDSQVLALEKADHLASRTTWTDKAEPNEKKDFLGDYIRDQIEANGGRIPAQLRKAHLHRIQLSAARGVSLMVLIPSPYHNDLAQELIDRFLSTCEAVLSDLEKLGKLSIGAEVGGSEGPYHVFLSYNTQDREIVETFARGLRAFGINPWYDEWALKRGQSVLAAIEDAIQRIPCAAVFVSSKGQGTWQAPEIETLLNIFIQTGGIVIPVLIDDIGITQLRPFLQNYRAIRSQDSEDPIRELADAVKEAARPKPALDLDRRNRGPHWRLDERPPD